ncbi:MAG: DUF4890 domain-containing protein [Bacteroidota bacterium]
MKNTTKFVLSLILLLAFSQITMAQRGRRGGDPQKRAERQTQQMVEQLSLSEAQAAKVKTVNMEMAKKMQEAFASAEGDRKAMRETMQTIREEHKTELKKYLTSEQFASWEKIQEERRGNRKERRKHDTKPNRDENKID